MSGDPAAVGGRPGSSVEGFLLGFGIVCTLVALDLGFHGLDRERSADAATAQLTTCGDSTVAIMERGSSRFSGLGGRPFRLVFGAGNAAVVCTGNEVTDRGDNAIAHVQPCGDVAGMGVSASTADVLSPNNHVYRVRLNPAGAGKVPTVTVCLE